MKPDEKMRRADLVHKVMAPSDLGDYRIAKHDPLVEISGSTRQLQILFRAAAR